jgi:hypothetical protein
MTTILAAEEPSAVASVVSAVFHLQAASFRNRISSGKPSEQLQRQRIWSKGRSKIKSRVNGNGSRAPEMNGGRVAGRHNRALAGVPMGMTRLTERIRCDT